MSTHAAHPGDLGVAEWLKLHLDQTVHVCSRLDKGTSGVLVMALTAEASAEAQRTHAGDRSRKTYRLVTRARPPRHEWVCREPLDGQEAETAFAVERQGSGAWLVAASIARGKRHQIRRHAQASGMPILGDADYGGAPFPRMCLHCSHVDWPAIPGPLASAIPPSFEAALAGAPALRTGTLAALERRGGWPSSIADVWRAVHRGEVEGMPFAVDVYGPCLAITGFDENSTAAELGNELGPVIDEVREATGARGAVLRTYRRDPHRKKLVADFSVIGEPPPPTLGVAEQGLLYEIALNDAQHPGLFPDQRDNRRRIAVIAAERRVANLFAFTCSFSAVAVKHGAEVAVSVDLAAGCLDRGVRNFALSGLAHPGRGKFVREDVRAWLARQLRKKAAEGGAFKAWDLVVCDPPVFAAAGRGGAFSVEREWPVLAAQVRAILGGGGVALFSNNHRGGDARAYHDALASRFGTVTRLNPPFDYPSLPGQPESVRMYWCEA
jgi:23S rRNA (cytosine1962-C5)-methyltransferase